jgi:AcrR family transcriptional regulator
MTVAGPTLSKDFILDGKRTRIMETAARAACERGIDGAKVSVLVREAGVARKTFYEIFTGKDDCLQQTLFWVAEAAHGAIVEAGEARAIGRAAHVRHALAALSDFIAEQPDLARFYVVLGPSISLPIFGEVQSYFAELLEPLGMEQTTRAMVVGGITESLRRHFLNGSSSDSRLQLKGHVDFVLLGAGAVG